MNPYWPLPADYPNLTKEGQRQARVAACALRQTPEERVAAWRFFRHYYLFPEGTNFYPIVRVDSPPFHTQGVYDENAYPFNIYAAPRGFGKSIVFGKELPLLDALTYPRIPIAIILNNRASREERFATFQQQLTDNERLIDDFGKMKPSQGTGNLWNLGYLRLANGSVLRGYTIGGQKRGGRFQKIYVDDPERDLPPKLSPEAARADLDNLLCRILIPMMPPPPFSNVFWICTMVNRQSFSWYVWAGADKRFRTWNKRFYAAEWVDPSTKEHRCLWPELWDKPRLEERRELIGDSAYAAEYLNQPASEQARTLKLEESRHCYTVDVSVADPNFHPFETPCTVSYPDRKTGRLVESPLQDLLLNQFRLITVDYAPTVNKMSDFSCINVMGIDSHNRAWLWDMWLGKVRQAQLIRLIYQMGKKWLVGVVGVESVGTQIELFESTKTYMRDRSLNMWLPRVVPIKYPNGISKADRMAGLEWRFDDDLILLPGDRQYTWPYVELFRQTRDFTYGLELLDHDDALDSVSMLHYVVHGQGASYDANAKRERSSVERALDLAQRGDLTEPETGFPIGSLLDTRDFHSPEAKQLVDTVRRQRYNTSKRRPRARLRNISISGLGGPQPWRT